MKDLRHISTIPRSPIGDVFVMTFLTSVLLIASTFALANSDRRGSDPLSEAETDRVRSAAAMRLSSARTKKDSAGIPADSHSVANPGESADNMPVLLLVERRLPDDKAKVERLADVYWYDYSDDTLLHSIVEVETGRIRRQESLHNTQLPLVESEIQRAAEIVMAHTETREQLEEAFQKITGRKLTGISDIDFKAFVFHADSLPAEMASDSAMCGFHRCARMVTYTRDNISLGVSPIINLSENRVTQAAR